MKKHYSSLIWLFPLGVIALFGILANLAPPPVHAQGENFFQVPFTAGVGTTIIPSCTGSQVPTPSAPCIPNQSQGAQAVTFNWHITSTTGVVYFLIEGSNNNQPPWLILAQNAQGTAGFLSKAIGNGDGFQNNFGGTLSAPVLPGTVTVSAGAVSGTDDGAGNISGAGVTGHITYSTGVISTNWLFPPPAIGVHVNVSYRVVNASSPTPGGVVYANGSFTFIRLYIVIPAGSVATLSGIYKPYAQSLPINLSADTNINSVLVGQLTQMGALAPTNVNVLEGVQCYNPNASIAYLQFLKSTSGSPAFGSGFYEIPIAGNSYYFYPGVPIQVWNMVPTPGALGTFWLGATTASAGSTPVTLPLECNVQLNTTGPFYPLTPVGP